MFTVFPFTGKATIILQVSLNNQIGYDENIVHISHCVRNHQQSVFMG